MLLLIYGRESAKKWMSNWDCEGESGLPGCVDILVDLLVEGYTRSAERTAPEGFEDRIRLWLGLLGTEQRGHMKKLVWKRDP